MENMKTWFVFNAKILELFYQLNLFLVYFNEYESVIDFVFKLLVLT